MGQQQHPMPCQTVRSPLEEEVDKTGSKHRRGSPAAQTYAARSARWERGVREPGADGTYRGQTKGNKNTEESKGTRSRARAHTHRVLLWIDTATGPQDIAYIRRASSVREACMRDRAGMIVCTRVRAGFSALVKST